ncbi:hypothetical protein, partial [Acidocella sp.]|uniref:hypothetical protein n=1 Tax=Acidocella sp. TaxID=50710 RepID=UPI0026144860
RRAKGARHPIRWEGFHRRPAINQSLLRWGEANSDPDVESKTTTRSGGGLANSIVPTDES